MSTNFLSVVLGATGNPYRLAVSPTNATRADWFCTRSQLERPRQQLTTRISLCDTIPCSRRGNCLECKVPLKQLQLLALSRLVTNPPQSVHKECNSPISITQQHQSARRRRRAFSATMGLWPVNCRCCLNYRCPSLRLALRQLVACDPNTVITKSTSSLRAHPVTVASQDEGEVVGHAQQLSKINAALLWLHSQFVH